MASLNKHGFIATTALLGLLALPVWSQVDNGGGATPPPPAPTDNGGGGTPPPPPPPADNGGGGGGGGGGQFRRDPAAMRQRMMQRLQTMLGASDDEFAVLQPKIEAVFQDQRDAGYGFGGRGGGFGGGRNRQNDNNPSTQPMSAAQQAQSDLRDALDDQNSTPDQIKAKLDAYRTARTEARANLAKAQQDLKDLLTQRQEAQLVLMGMLD